MWSKLGWALSAVFILMTLNFKDKGSGPYYACQPGIIYGSNCYHYTTKEELETKVRPWLEGE